MHPFVSVVITAHSRKQYILEAVKSVLQLSLDRTEYEIIIVKNFTDDNIDFFLKKEGIKAIYTDEDSFGAKLAIGIDNSNGEVISFLDDDDQFDKNKILALKQVFMDQKVIYHHSSIRVIDEYGKEHTDGLSRNIPHTEIVGKLTPSKMKLVMKYKLDWYMSAISCRSSVLKSRSAFIRGKTTSLDKLMFLICLEAGGSLYFDARLLTRYRIHESLTTRITNIDDFLKARKEFYIRSLKNLTDTSGTITTREAKYLIDWEIIHGRLLAYFFSDDRVYGITARSLIKYSLLSIVKGFGPITKWALSDILRKFFPAIMRTNFYRRSLREFKRYS